MSETPLQAIHLEEKLALFDQHWSPRVITEHNDYRFKLFKLLGDAGAPSPPETTSGPDPLRLFP